MVLSSFAENVFHITDPQKEIEHFLDIRRCFYTVNDLWKFTGIR